MGKKCSQCHTPIPEGHSECPTCGKAYEAPAPAEEHLQPPSGYPPHMQQPGYPPHMMPPGYPPQMPLPGYPPHMQQPGYPPHMMPPPPAQPVQPIAPQAAQKIQPLNQPSHFQVGQGPYQQQQAQQGASQPQVQKVRRNVRHQNAPVQPPPSQPTPPVQQAPQPAPVQQTNPAPNLPPQQPSAPAQPSPQQLAAMQQAMASPAPTPAVQQQPVQQPPIQAVKPTPPPIQQPPPPPVQQPPIQPAKPVQSAHPLLQQPAQPAQPAQQAIQQAMQQQAEAQKPRSAPPPPAKAKAKPKKEPPPPPEVPEYQGPRGGPIKLGPVTFMAAIEDDAELSFNVKVKDFEKEVVIKIAVIFKVIAAFLMFIFFAFPMISVSVSPNPWGKANSSALQATMGCEVFGGFIFPVLLLLVPIALILAFVLKNKFEAIGDMLEDGLFKLTALISIAGAGLYIVTAIIYIAVVSGELALGENVSQVSAHPFMPGFILPILLYVICGGISWICILSQNKILTVKE